MARMALAVSPQRASRAVSEFVCHLALLPNDDDHNDVQWSIDEEAIDATWHDSSWMLRKGLDVIEDFELDPVREGWARTWRAPAATEPSFPSLRLVDLG